MLTQGKLGGGPLKAYILPPVGSANFQKAHELKLMGARAVLRASFNAGKVDPTLFRGAAVSTTDYCKVTAKSKYVVKYSSADSRSIQELKYLSATSPTLRG